MSSNDDYGFPAHVPPEATISATSTPSKRTRRTTARKRKSEPNAPRWFESDRANQAAEFIAFNVAIDRMLGVTPSLEGWPYSEFKPKATANFLAKLATIQPLPSS